MTLLERLSGHWRLVSFTQRAADGSWPDALSAGAIGYISYLPSGHMSVVMGGSLRPRFRGAWDSIPDREKAACLDDMVAYSGTFVIEENTVIHQVEVCWIPNWQGRKLLRHLSFPSENRMLLSTPVLEGERAPAPQQVLWERVS